MGKTYSHIPIAIADIFRLIIAEVSTNLAAEGTLSIPQIAYMHGTLSDINNQLASKTRNPSAKALTFPMVLFLYKADERFTDKYNDEINVEILICTSTKPTYTNDDRYSINFLPILYPIYAELKSVIGNSRYFWGYKRKFEHTKTDLPHAGQESANGPVALNFSTHIDAIMLSNMKLKVAVRPLEVAPPNYCQFTACPYGREVFYINIFKSVSFSGLNTAIITASVDDFYFLDASGGLPAPFAPEIDWQDDGNWIAMSGGPLAPFTASFDVTTGYGTGFYKGTIRFSDASVNFYYKVKEGKVCKMTTLIEQDATLGLDCRNDPDYPITVDTTHTMALYNPDVVPVGQEEEPIMVGYELQVFGDVINTETFLAVLTHTAQNTAYSDYQSANYQINNNFSYGAQSPLINKSIFKTRCKTSL